MLLSQEGKYKNKNKNKNKVVLDATLNTSLSVSYISQIIQSTNTEDVIQRILGNYHMLVRPNEGQGEVEVKFGVSLQGIDSVDEEAAQVTVLLWQNLVGRIVKHLKVMTYRMVCFDYADVIVSCNWDHETLMRKRLVSLFVYKVMDNYIN